MADVSYILMRNSLNTLALHSMENAVVPGEEGDELANVKSALKELFLSGRASGDYFVSSREAVQESSLDSWLSSLNDTLSSVGLYISRYEADVDVRQSAVDKVEYELNLRLFIKDVAGAASLEKDYVIRRNISVSGLVDPAIYRESVRLGASPIYRRFYFNPSSSEPSLSVSTISRGLEGAGWVYGPLATVASNDLLAVPSAEEVPLRERPFYILVGTFDEITSFPGYENFGGYVITNSVPQGREPGEDCRTQENTFYPLAFEERSGVCQVVEDYSGGLEAQKPFIVVPDFDPASAPECYVPSEGVKRRCALLSSSVSLENVRAKREMKQGEVALYDVENPRDFALCGYYRYTPLGPSFLQRMLNNSFSYADVQFGLETFLIGNYAAGEEFDLYSRLDRELFSRTPGKKIRGLPGCKNAEQCNEDSPIGVFTVSDPSAFGWGAIAEE